ncbi:hypothetical protein [Geodermatophilus sp. URMC 60]
MTCRREEPLVDGPTVDPARDVVGLLRGTGERCARLVAEFLCRPAPR